MRKIFIPAVLFFSAVLLFSCKQENSSNTNATTNKDTSTTPLAATDTGSPAPASAPANMKQWAEQVESSINLTVPEDWSPEDWNNIFRKVDRKAIYADVIDAVVSGKQTAYNFFTDAALTMDQVKSILDKKVTVKNAENKISLESVSPNTISLMRVREKVFFDKDNFKLERKPTSLILYVSHYSEDGTFVGYQPLFYVKLNN